MDAWTEPSEESRLLVAPAVDTASIRVEDTRTIDSNGGLRSGRWTWNRTSAAFVVFAGLGALGISVTCRLKGGGDVSRPTELAESMDAQTMDISGRTLSMMKRTHLSINAIKEGIWLQDVLGFGVAAEEYFFNSSGNSYLYQGEDLGSVRAEAMEYAHNGHKRICSARSEFSWYNINDTNTYDWHEFQGSLSMSGPLGPDYWWDVIYQMNTHYDSPTSTNVWNAFLHAGQHMYVNDLTTHVVHLESTGTPYLARSYVSQADGDDGKTMYVVFVPNPYNGNVVIIHSGAVGNWHARNFFRELEAEACVKAVSLPYPLSTLDKWWENVYIDTVSNRSLPKPYPVMDTQPVYDLDEVVDYFENKLQIKKWAEVDLLKWSNIDNATEVADGGICATLTIEMQTQFSTDYQLKYIYTPSAKNFDEVGRLHKYVDDNVRKMVGFNTGYNRWMDNHVAVSLPQHDTNDDGQVITYLDDLRPFLETAKTPYHIHFTEVKAGVDTGSIWAWGPGGLGIEYHGGISYKSFEYPVGNFDFCSADSVCKAEDTMCNMNISISGASR